MNFWQELPRPFFVLAPMEDVTDTVFRQIVAKVGSPDVFVTEFTHVDAICHWAATSPSAAADPPLLNSGEGRGEVIINRLVYTEAERPIVAQIWGTNPNSFFRSAQVIKGLGFDGIDINMGCPVKDIVKQGGCSALIGNTTLVSEIIDATRQAGLPVSVKTRIGRKNIETEDWIGFLLTQDLSALTIHGRIAAEMSKVAAHWDEIAKATKLPNPSGTLIIGNGDVKSLDEAKEKIERYHVDGIMIGRGIFENVGLFSQQVLTTNQKLELLKDHIQLFYNTWGRSKDFQILKKFVKIYINGFAGAAEVRQNIMNMIS